MTEQQLKERKQLIYEAITAESYRPMKVKELAILLQIPRENRADLQQVLDELILEGKIQVSKKGKYQKAKTDLITGTFTAHPKGFGFVTIEGEENDVYISEQDTNGAMHKDTVQIVMKPGRGGNGKRQEGKITNIIVHATKELVGTYEKSQNFGFVTPDNARFTKDIFIPREHENGAVNGHKVIVEITNYGKADRKPEGRIKEVLGHFNDPGVDILSIIKEYELPERFDKPVQRAAAEAPQEVMEEEISGRSDYRNLLTITIDGEDAKDLDDAITLEQEGEDYVLGVHIADVTHYVKEGSILDKEAYKRGTSVYLADRVIPMLPHALSNGICSLNAGTDRLALSCVMRIDKKGSVTDHTISESVLHVDERMSYTDVRTLLEDSDTELEARYAQLIPMLRQMEELAAILRANRFRKGAIDFDFPESKIILDHSGNPVEIKAYDRNVATKLIEEFMLLANETVAEDYFWQEIPFVYRTHDNPDPEQIQKLGLFINNFGYAIKIGKDDIHPKELQKLLGKIEGTPEEMLISRLTLRSMKQAKYTTTNTGHFGLASQYYCHFTSPIRRYPDLQIHRIIKETLRGKMTEARVRHYEKHLPETAKHSSEMERRAEEAERETLKLKKAQYMEARIGQEFIGVISSLTSWGMYVELENTVEGMIHITKLIDDYYNFDEERQELVGEHTHKTYKLGQIVRIRVTGADRQLRQIDFELV